VRTSHEPRFYTLKTRASCRLSLPYLGKWCLVLHDILVGGEENIEAALANLGTQTSPHRRGALEEWKKGRKGREGGQKERVKEL